MARRLSSIENAATYLGVNPRTVRRLIARGELPGYRISGRLIRVDLDEIDQLCKPIPTAGSGDDAA